MFWAAEGAVAAADVVAEVCAVAAEVCAVAAAACAAAAASEVAAPAQAAGTEEVMVAATRPPIARPPCRDGPAFPRR
jgi:hypothetical protein